MEDCAIAAILLQLTAQYLGVGSCWVKIRRRNHADREPSKAHIRELLWIPDSLSVEAIISIGYPAEQPTEVPKEMLDADKIRGNRWE